MVLGAGITATFQIKQAFAADLGLFGYGRKEGIRFLIRRSAQKRVNEE